MRKSSTWRHILIRLVTLLIISMVALHPHEACAQQARDYGVHANIIYHFTKYIDWPYAKKTGPFVITVLGESAVYEQLEKSIEGKMVNGQKISVTRISTINSAINCHILFISDEESDDIKNISAKTSNRSILLVTESPGLAKRGGCINFAVVSEKLKLEINKSVIEARGLNIASELLQLGKIVK